MPTYNYKCESCDYTDEKVLRMAERNQPIEAPCPTCGALTVRQVISGGAAFVEPSWTKKIDGDFKYAMNKMKKRHPRSNIPDY